MSDRYKNYGKAKKEEDEDEEPVRLTVKERREQHRAMHPNDLVSFGEDPIPKPKRASPSKKIPAHPTTLIAMNDKALLDSDKTALMGLSIREVRSMCVHMFKVFMLKNDLTDEDVSAGWKPVDSQGEPIPRAKGAGRGKEGFVDWLIEYDEHFRVIRKEMELSHEMGQTLMG